MTDKELTYKVAFSLLSGMGIDVARKLLDVVGSEEALFTMSQAEVVSLMGSKSKISNSLHRKKCLDQAVKELDFIKKNKIKVTYFTDADFPARLQNAPDAPVLLYSLGPCDLNSKHVVGIVGTRHATVHGQRFIDDFVAELAELLPDLVIVSGLAYGVDIMSHRAAMRNNVPTVGVVAHGLNTIYPATHRADSVAMLRAGGAIVTEYTSQARTMKSSFLARNRIIAALCDCIVVVESASKGGALVTANIANSYDRDVFAVPGRLTDEYSRGCNKLIQNNAAVLLSGADDLVKAMRWETHVRKTEPMQVVLFEEYSQEEEAILTALDGVESEHVNVLASKAGMPVYALMSVLVDLEYKNAVAALPGGRYTRLK